MRNTLWVLGVAVVFACLGLADRVSVADEKSPPAGAATFEMKEFSLFDAKNEMAGTTVPGLGVQALQLSTAPSKKVKAYPKLNTPRPLYGSVILDRDPEKETGGQRYYFVFDQSPEAIQAAEAAAKAAEEKAAKPDKGDKSDKAKKTKKTRKKTPAGAYDLLYVDADGDLDLTNNPAVRLRKDSAAVAERLGMEEMRFFDVIRLTLKGGASIRLLPAIEGDGGTRTALFAPATAWEGEIRLGKQAFRATLVQSADTVGRYDRPSTTLRLAPAGDTKSRSSTSWLDTLGMIREVEGEFYTITASPSGDKLYVRPVPGDRGVLEVSAGGRDIKDLGLTALLQRDDSVYQLGEMPSGPAAEPSRVSRYRLPVGKYQPMMLEVRFGTLVVSLRADYRKARGEKMPETIEIRKDKPYVIDFREKAEMQFLSPAKDKVFKPGDNVSFAAMLSIADKNLLLAGLEDRSRKIGEVKWQDDNGKEQTGPRYAEVEPEVVITDAAGKKLGGGKMPFG